MTRAEGRPSIEVKNRGRPRTTGAMADFRPLVPLSRELEQTPARLEKLRLVAGFLRALPAEAVASAVLFLTGRAFPPSDPRALGIRWLPSATEPTAGPPLRPADVAAAVPPIAQAPGPRPRPSRRPAPADARRDRRRRRRGARRPPGPLGAGVQVRRRTDPAPP